MMEWRSEDARMGGAKRRLRTCDGGKEDSEEGEEDIAGAHGVGLQGMQSGRGKP